MTQHNGDPYSDNLLTVVSSTRAQQRAGRETEKRLEQREQRRNNRMKERDQNREKRRQKRREERKVLDEGEEMDADEAMPPSNAEKSTLNETVSPESVRENKSTLLGLVEKKYPPNVSGALPFKVASLNTMPDLRSPLSFSRATAESLEGNGGLYCDQDAKFGHGPYGSRKKEQAAGDLAVQRSFHQDRLGVYHPTKGAKNIELVPIEKKVSSLLPFK